MSWICPYCNKPATIREMDVGKDQANVHQRKTDEGWIMFELTWVLCPAPDCQKITVDFTKYIGDEEFQYYNGGGYLAKNKRKVHTQRLFPRGMAKPLPHYIPSQIVQDYQEACLIIGDSPKAAATLFRRCLQAMIRDFWKIKKNTLYKEMEELIKLHPDTEDFLHPIRELGNIGAHPETDINLIVPIEPGEAELMRETIEHLIEEWYVSKHKTELRKKNLKVAVANKAQLKASGTP